MKLTIERAALLKTLAHVQSAVERRNTIPILSNVLIDVSEGTLALTATDMDLTIVDAVPVEMAEPGATTAPVHTLYDIVRKLPEGAQVEISTGGDGSQITIEAGRSVFTLATLPGGASVGSVSEGITALMKGRLEKAPYFASS